VMIMIMMIKILMIMMMMVHWVQRCKNNLCKIKFF